MASIVACVALGIGAVTVGLGTLNFLGGLFSGGGGGGGGGPSPVPPPVTPAPVGPVGPGGWYLGIEGQSCDLSCLAYGAPTCTDTSMKKITSYEAMWSVEGQLFNGLPCEVYGTPNGLHGGFGPSFAGYVEGACVFYDGNNPSSDLSCTDQDDFVSRFCCCGTESDCTTNDFPEIPTTVGNTEWHIGFDVEDCLTTCQFAGGKSCTNIMADVDTVEELLYVSKNLASTTASCDIIATDGGFEFPLIVDDPFLGGTFCEVKTVGDAMSADCDKVGPNRLCCCADLANAPTACPLS